MNAFRSGKIHCHVWLPERRSKVWWIAIGCHYWKSPNFAAARVQIDMDQNSKQQRPQTWSHYVPFFLLWPGRIKKLGVDQNLWFIGTWIGPKSPDPLSRWDSALPSPAAWRGDPMTEIGPSAEGRSWRILGGTMVKSWWFQKRFWIFLEPRQGPMQYAGISPS
jgi:hypothetical protein